MSAAATLLGSLLTLASPPASDAAPEDDAPSGEAPADDVSAGEAPADETPPDETPADEAPGDDAPAQTDPTGSDEDSPADTDDAGPSDAGGDAPSEGPPQPPDASNDLPRDERYEPILPYGEAPDTAEVEFADETPPPPEVRFADETPSDPELRYDQSRQRRSPSETAIRREGDESDELGQEQFEGRQESPQRFAVEIKFGPYLPSVDRRWTGEGFGPYATIFGRTNDRGETTRAPRLGLFTVFGFEWQFAHAGGPFSVGTTIGYFRDRADALIAEPEPDADTVRAGADRTVFHVVPITLLLGYRFELLADRFRVPLVPYARGGVAMAPWRSTKGGELTRNEAGQRSLGVSWGWQVNLGLMLRLDFIERAAAVDLDRQTGINHTYVFGEWQFSRLDNFGVGNAMAVGDDTFLLGLAVEF